MEESIIIESIKAKTGGETEQQKEADGEMLDAKESWNGQWTEGEGGRRNTLSDTATGRRGRISPSLLLQFQEIVAPYGHVTPSPQWVYSSAAIIINTIK